VLHDIRRMPMSLHDPLITRFKEMAEMNLVEKRLPQDGRARFTYLEPGKQYDLRMSVLPTFYGENIVIRILDRTNVLLGLDRMESAPTELDAIRNWMCRPNGMIVATGPTGSGKSTMLYSCLNELDGEWVNILTVEDPIEYLIPNVTQIQVNRRAGLNFAAAMRSFLRQDPDVILCSQFRDLETSELAIEAAVTGHLVLGALHTEDAVTALLRLIDIGVARHLVPATLVGVVALRLARRLCTQCKVEAANKTVDDKMERVRRLAKDGGYVVPEDAVFYSSLGCEKCRRTGYRGRIGLYEVLTCTPNLVDRLLKCDSADEMKRLAVQSGMRTLLADAIRKAVAGETSIDEALRVAEVWM
jgi:type IV pilus assembly protein PilB